MPSALSILLVDEEPLLCRATALLLSNRGGRVSTAGTLAEALVLSDDHVFDVAILDVSPSGPSAEVMLARLRSHGALPRRFVVCLPDAPSGENDFTVVLRKPFPFEDLIAAVFGRGRARPPARSGVYPPLGGAMSLAIRPSRRAARARRDRE
jgi:DNA-binding response OmpR family regulator